MPITDFYPNPADLALKLADGTIKGFKIKSTSVDGLTAAIKAISDPIEAKADKNTADITTNTTAIAAINGKIPTSATTENQLATMADIASSEVANTRLYLGADAAGAQFATKAALTAATQFFSKGVAVTPKKDDYVIVTADEDHNGMPATYFMPSVGGAWTFKFAFNPLLSPEMMAAANSGVNAQWKADTDAAVAAAAVKADVDSALALKADKTTTDALQTALDGKASQSALDAAVSTHSTDKQALEDAIALKADKTDVAALGTVVTKTGDADETAATLMVVFAA